MIQTPHLDALMSGPWPQWARERKEEAIMSMWAKEGTPAGDLFNLISDYFDAGYLEGKEGRSTDTPDGKADKISSAIHEHLQRYASLEAERDGLREQVLDMDCRRTAAVDRAEELSERLEYEIDQLEECKDDNTRLRELVGEMVKAYQGYPGPRGREVYFSDLIARAREEGGEDETI